MLNLLPQTISIEPIYPLLRFLFFISRVQVEFNFKFCNVTYNMMPYARKIHYIFFVNIFHAELYLCDKFCVKYFQLMKITMKNS